MPSDHELFNCGQEHEINYVAGRYPNDKTKVKEFLITSCQSKKIHHSTHAQVYELIKKELGLPIP
ncbi:hypothetical protein [Leptospira dzoumogneensis]|uniref:Uncharacterized protein n=1 Tax=Leptospira dzoumogneensis TaxID=2484904 RepID=A0A4Z1AMA7_9LEPT|nr:hypothetical protein [Leptospira dzoumogneensis]TGN02869.1 hypothetical protein EHR06_02345 [Leptospira dzoumogneensis]